MATLTLPTVPARHDKFLEYVASCPNEPLLDLIAPYKEYDAELRKVFAQQPTHPAISTPNIVPVFNGFEHTVKIRARDLASESPQQKESYIMPLKAVDRKADATLAIVKSLDDFKTNFNVFSEGSLADLDWSNVVVAGSAVVTALQSVPEKHAESKRTLRTYYHEEFAPASDVDLFLYGLTEEQAMEKIKQIERQIRDALLVETTTIRTKNAITIASQYPTRHVQIVLRIYKSISEILTGFDVDCSCAAFDGTQVWASPRALVAYMTQINTIDLTRRSPSYENRLSKYAKRGFEIFWPDLDRSRVDPTIFERTFGRTQGLARLLVLETLPKSTDREAYLDQRRAERGRPPINRYRQRRRQVTGNVKTGHEDEVAEWVESDEVADYHTFTIPYGPKIHARHIERMLYTKDMLLNAEWNKKKDRADISLHRHPAFFGRVEDVMLDCCGFCPAPANAEEEELAEKESKVYVSGKLSFIQDDPGRQAIGSFNPLSAKDWTEMAYVSNTGMFCEAIVEKDAEYVRSWLDQDGNDPNARDWTGRTPLHLAVAESSLEIVQLLLDHGARLIPRLADGQTVLHLAARRGDVDIIAALLRKSEVNEEEEQKKVDSRRAARAMAAAKAKDGLESTMPDATSPDEDIEMLEDEGDEGEPTDATTEGSVVNIKTPSSEQTHTDNTLDDENDSPDILDINAVAWDTGASPLHLAIIQGHEEVVKCLVQDFGADVLQPIKLFNDWDKSARAAILTLVLALQLPLHKARSMTKTLLQLGATVAQADLEQRTVLQYCVAERPELLETYHNVDPTGVGRAINHLSASGYKWQPDICSALMTAIRAKDALAALQLLSLGAKAEIPFRDYIQAYQTKNVLSQDVKANLRLYHENQRQPVLLALECQLPQLCAALVTEYGADPNTLATTGHQVLQNEYFLGYAHGHSLLDVLRETLKVLRGWKPPIATMARPHDLREDAAYLSDFAADSYSLWSAQKQLGSAKEKHKQAVEWHSQNLQQTVANPGNEKKQEAISKLIREFEEAEAILLRAGAKTFKELHPEVVSPPRADLASYQHQPATTPPFTVEFSFRLGGLTSNANDRYRSLFEAVWEGNISKVKELTLSTWKDTDGEVQPPLQVAVFDQHGVSPLHIAVARQHAKVAEIILEIADAQHAKPLAKVEHYEMVTGDADEEDTDAEDDDDVRVTSEVVDDQFTIDNIGEVSSKVQSAISALALLRWECGALESIPLAPGAIRKPTNDGFKYFGPRKDTSTLMGRSGTKKPSRLPDGIVERQWKIPAPCSLIQLAIRRDDKALLEWILTSMTSRLRASDDAEPKAFPTISDEDFLYTIQADRPHLAEILIRQTGSGLPLDELAEQCGVEIPEKPKFYQGLSIHGRKRKDWAAAARGRQEYEAIKQHNPPLLHATHRGSQACIEWFSSDRPLECYMDFADVNREDKRLRQLAQTEDGFEGTCNRFLSARWDLVIHCHILGRGTAGEDDGVTLRYLISTFPSAIDAKSVDGLTPLHIAMEMYDFHAARMLIEAGADQTARDIAGNNILHRLLARGPIDERTLKKLPVMLELIDRRLLKSLFLERSAEAPGSATPLMRVPAETGDSIQHVVDTMRLLLSYSGGDELGLINGAGDTILHEAVRKNRPEIVRVILEHDAMLLNRENATGRTPYEVAEDASITAICADPPPMPTDRHNYELRKARRLGLPGGWMSEVTQRTPESFVHSIAPDQRDNRERVWDLVQEAKDKLVAQGKWKRRLVTLNEAREVAKRLAAVKAGEAGTKNLWQRQRDGDALDEVAQWLPDAERRL